MSAPSVALVTGATSGIGRATSILLSERGLVVAAAGRDRTRLGELERQTDGRIVPFPCDLVEPGAAERLVEAVVGKLGGLSGLVNAAGILEPGGAEATSLEAFDRTMDINVRSVFALSRAALPALRAAAPSAIVNVSSVAGLRPFPGLLAYCVSKAAVDHMTRCMAIELAPERVRVNAVDPGVVVTELHRRGGMSDEAYEAFLERSKSTHPLGRVGRPEEVAELIAYLLSDKAGFITGETIAIDGGRHLTALR
jgi:NAD(P)-dependent dehydrogenase (short-subunit alcohol dehydrogenase family)